MYLSFIWQFDTHLDAGAPIWFRDDVVINTERWDAIQYDSMQFDEIQCNVIQLIFNAFNVFIYLHYNSGSTLGFLVCYITDIPHNRGGTPSISVTLCWKMWDKYYFETTLRATAIMIIIMTGYTVTNVTLVLSVGSHDCD